MKLWQKKIFVTKADKGGATMVMNYNDVHTAIKNELNNSRNFTLPKLS